ncbi:MAG: hypothetical protein ACPKNR_02040 [Pleomorphochaeta sp.]
MDNIFIVIPTYWQGTKYRKRLQSDLTFDHPTFLDGEETLTKSLDSIKNIKTDKKFKVLIITATVDESLNEEVEKRVEDIISPFKQNFDIAQFGFRFLDKISKEFKRLNIDDNFLTLNGYSSIRNCQLAIPYLLGSQIIGAIDDDEVVENNYIDQISKFVGKDDIDGIAGRYRYGNGSVFVKERSKNGKEDRLFIKKQNYQNEVYRFIENSDDDILFSPIVLGGNMVFSKKLIQNVPFDPFVPRGEDIDYLINSILLGYNWRLDKNLFIDHYPPQCKETNKLQEDVLRFIYEKAKIKKANESGKFCFLDVALLKEYPGNYLKDNLEEEAKYALDIRPKDIESESWYSSTTEVMEKGVLLKEKVNEFFDYAAKWPENLEKLNNDERIKKILDLIYNK